MKKPYDMAIVILFGCICGAFVLESVAFYYPHWWAYGTSVVAAFIGMVFLAWWMDVHDHDRAERMRKSYLEAEQRAFEQRDVPKLPPLPARIEPYDFEASGNGRG